MTISMSRRGTAAALTLACTFTTVSALGAVAAPAPASSPVRAASAGTPASQPGTLTNLSHLNWLGAQVQVRPVDGHSTFDLAANPSVGVLWTYADHHADGTYTRVGGGAYDASTNTYSQGAYNADDMARASVVYLRHWQQTGSQDSRARALALLRGLTYLQTESGPNAGDVVLWMQPDGTLNPSAIPKELPDSSDSATSYWLARTIWALGEGYAAFRNSDPQFATFLAGRMHLAIGALNRDSLSRYGQYLQVDGRRTPAWLVAEGADASGEALLGLAAYVRASDDPTARTALTKLANGVAAMQGDSATRSGAAAQSRTATQWPFGAILPWARSTSLWHAWGGLAPAGLTRAGLAVGDRSWVRSGAVDTSTFTPWLLTAGGPDNGISPTPVDRSQIAYGVDSRVESAMSSADATHSRGAEEVAALAASWFFGANPAGVPVYDRTTGATVDGIAADGTINRNSGAESTIHTQLTMLALDVHPLAARLAQVAAHTTRDGLTTLEAESGTLRNGAIAVTPASLWTGESQYGGTGYAHLPVGSSVTVPIPGTTTDLVMPVVNFQHGSPAVLTVTAGGHQLGTIRVGDVGSSGDSGAPGALLPATLAGLLAKGQARSVTLTAQGGPVDLDAVMVQPAVLDLTHQDDATSVTLIANHSPRPMATPLSGPFPARVEIYDGAGSQRAAFPLAHTRDLTLTPGEYAIVTAPAPK